MAANHDSIDAIGQALRPLGGADYVVAFSGGVDSTVLLHYLVRMLGPGRVRAVHVQHNLQPLAADWAEHCRSRAKGLGVALSVCRVRVDKQDNRGVEAAARDARYAALAAAIQPGEVLVTGHHADDQAQTFLLQALRGAGVRGLAAMPFNTEFGSGRHIRPMLGITRAQIHAYARTYELDWIDDPSNIDPAVDRSYLNAQVWPLIQAHWPGAAKTLSRAASLCADDAKLAAERADMDLVTCRGTSADCLSVESLAELSPHACRNLLRRWLDMQGLPPPRRRHLQAIESDCLHARPDARPLVAWPGAEVRRYRDDLHAMAPLPRIGSAWSALWRPPAPLPLPRGGTLGAQCGIGGLAPEYQYRVRFRAPGERVRLPGRAHDTALKSALQEAGVAPWLRDRVPLIVSGGRIAAVPDLWICDAFAASENQPGWCARWGDAPAGWPPQNSPRG